MSRHVGGKPISKCKGCCLNMRTFCAAGLEPRQEWSKGTCKVRNNYSILENYLHDIAPITLNIQQRRRVGSVKMKTAPHYNEQVFLPDYYTGNDFSYEG